MRGQEEEDDEERVGQSRRRRSRRIDLGKFWKLLPNTISRTHFYDVRFLQRDLKEPTLSRAPW